MQHLEAWGLLAAVVVAVFVPFGLDLLRGRISRKPTMEIDPKPTPKRPRYLFWD